MKKSKLSEKIVKYLEKAGVKHDILEHKTVYTAIDAAATMKKKLGEIAKSLLVKADKDYYLVLLPADHNLDFDKLKKTINNTLKSKDIHPVKSGGAGAKQFNGVKMIKIPTEKVMQEALRIKAGALSAFGKIHKLPVVVDEQLAKAKKAVFSSGSLNHSIEMAVKDFAKMENAIMGKFGVKKKIKIVVTKKTKTTKIVKKAVSKKINKINKKK